MSQEALPATLLSPAKEAELQRIAQSLSLAESSLQTLRRLYGGDGQAPEVDAAARYEDLGPIASGAMGEVRRVWDNRLERSVAMKLVHPELQAEREIARRFLREARIVAGLQHPGIVAVYDMGQREDGQLWFTMTEVRGQTLGAIFAERGARTFRRLVDLYGRVCDTVAYAHAQGVIHRDLKPENIMVGEHGQVLVMDWGLGKRLADGPDAAAEVPPRPRELPSKPTELGAVMGTPAYMSPEQAKGEGAEADARSDVYSLGVILYELLSGAPPFTGSAHEVWVAVLTREPPSLDERAPHAPAALRAICARALASDPEARFPDAGALRRAVGDWLDGAQKAEQARAQVQRARLLLPDIAAAREKAARLREEAESLLEGVQSWDPEAKKRPAWGLQDRAQEIERGALLDETRYEEALHAALKTDPELDDAHDALAELYRRRVVQAEARRDPDAASRNAVRLQAHDRGQHRAWLRGDGKLSLVTEPPGARVQLLRYALRDRRLVCGEAELLGETPLRAQRVPRGSHLLRIEAEGRAPVHYPLRVGRLQHWDGVAPGAKAPAPVELPPEAQRGDDCYVPGGWFSSGGDPDAIDGTPARRHWVDAFFIQRHPITNAEYLDFLNDLLRRGDPALAERHAPQTWPPPEGASIGELLVAREGDAGFVLAELPEGGRWPEDAPVVLVSWEGAMAYAQWRAARDGLPWRLPHDLEWEKAARGVDGRHFPFGDQLDGAWACIMASHAQTPRQTSVHDFPADESPYGMRGAAGNVRDWCLNGYRRAGEAEGRVEVTPPGPDETLRMVRGGVWSAAENFCRLASRFAARPTDRLRGLGFRLARPLQLSSREKM